MGYFKNHRFFDQIALPAGLNGCLIFLNGDGHFVALIRALKMVYGQDASLYFELWREIGKEFIDLTGLLSIRLAACKSDETVPSPSRYKMERKQSPVVSNGDKHYCCIHRAA
jgi:hypothetical protein